MAAFSFGFDSEDIEEDEEAEEKPKQAMQPTSSGQEAELAPAKLHTLDEMLATLPSSISYSTHKISTDPVLLLPRRELFDIRAQLLAETDPSDTLATTLTEGLTSDDIKPGLYEGGFKTWECSIDLARMLLKNDRAVHVGDWTNYVEIGAGTSLPMCTVLYSLLQQDPPERAVSGPSSVQRSLVVADYNYHVLTHAAIPNLLLTFAMAYTDGGNAKYWDSTLQGDLEITHELLRDFRKWLHHMNLQVIGISGAWSHQFNDIMDQYLSQGNTMILASETIYQPDSLPTFVDVLLNILRNKDELMTENKALIAAKKVYFGVGGGIDEFSSFLHAKQGSASCVWDSGSAGVGRVIFEVQNSS